MKSDEYKNGAGAVKAILPALKMKALVSVMALTTVVVAWAGSPSVRILSLDDSAGLVRLSLSGVTTDMALYALWDVKDHAADVGAWANAEMVSRVTAGTSELAVSLPTSVDVWKNSVRFALVNESRFTPLSYIESDGRQYVDTEYRPWSTDSVEMGFSVLDVSAGFGIFDARNASNGKCYTAMMERAYDGEGPERGTLRINLVDSKDYSSQRLQVFKQTIKLFMAGDSTLDEHKGEENPLGYVSWGVSLKPYLKDDVEIVDYARAGFTTAAFMSADPYRGNVVWWNRIKEEVRSGDWVMIQFGHNDEKSLSVEQYAANLKTMVADVATRGAIPVLVTPIVRLTFENGYLVDNSYVPPLETYAEAMRTVAVETGAQLAEMRELTRNAAQKAGEAEALSWNVADDTTHLAEKGAKLYASIFYEYVKQSGLKFAAIFR